MMIDWSHSPVKEAMYLGKIATRGFLDFFDYLDFHNDHKMVPPSFLQKMADFWAYFCKIRAKLGNIE